MSEITHHILFDDYLIQGQNALRAIPLGCFFGWRWHILHGQMIARQRGTDIFLLQRVVGFIILADHKLHHFIKTSIKGQQSIAVPIGYQCRNRNALFVQLFDKLMAVALGSFSHTAMIAAHNKAPFGGLNDNRFVNVAPTYLGNAVALAEIIKRQYLCNVC